MIANEVRSAELAIFHLISNKLEWNNCFIKNNQEVLLDLADSALQEQRIHCKGLRTKILLVYAGPVKNLISQTKNKHK